MASMFTSKKKRAAAKALRLADDSSFGRHTPRSGGDDETNANGNGENVNLVDDTSNTEAAPGEEESEPSSSGKRTSAAGNTIFTTISSTCHVNAQQLQQPKAFVPKQSERAKKKQITADNDVWQEQLAVVEMVLPASGNGNDNEQFTNAIRSYFVSTETGGREWDEPPSGASNVEYATEQMHAMAKAQMESILEDLNIISAERQTEMGGGALSQASGSQALSATASSKKKSKGLKKIFKRKMNSDSSSRGSGAAPVGGGQARISRSEVYSRQIQRAMAMSLEGMPADEQFGSRAVSEDEDDEELAMAKALSLSVTLTTQEAPFGSDNNGCETKKEVPNPFDMDALDEKVNTTLKLTPAEQEDEMLRQAIEASKNEMVHTVSQLKREESLLLGLGTDPLEMELKAKVAKSAHVTGTSDAADKQHQTSTSAAKDGGLNAETLLQPPRPSQEQPLMDLSAFDEPAPPAIVKSDSKESATSSSSDISVAHSQPADRRIKTQELAKTRIQVSQIYLSLSQSSSFDTTDGSEGLRSRQQKPAASTLLKVSAVGGRRKRASSQPRWSLKTKLAPAATIPLAAINMGKSETTDLA
jgi:hypothetical protein